MHSVKRALRRLLVALPPVLLVLLAATSAGAQGGEGRAGLVVQYGDGAVETACVRFAEPEISGVELLERSGLPVVTQDGGMGAAVCKIGPDGCDYPAEGCFCEREGSRSIYWAFYTLDRGAWAYTPLGATSTMVRDGDVQGWAWGLGESGSGAAPPVVDFATVCGPAGAEAPSVASAPAPTAAPAASAAGAPDPTLAPAPAETAPATGAPLATATPAPAASAAPSPAEGAPWGYAGFAILVVILAAGAAILARRR